VNVDHESMAASDDVLRVAIVDDHEMVRDGLRAVFETAVDIELVGQAGTVAEAIPMLLRTRPNVALVDIQLPDGSGIEICRAVASDAPDVR
jgi:DNA-binding NarL/FixJ family response regulator